MKIVITGDSHTRAFRKSRNVAGWEENKNQVFVNAISAASAKGLAKDTPSPRTVKKIWRTSRRSRGATDVFVFCYGQVDVEAGFVYSRAVKERDIGIEQFCEEFVARYVTFCATLSSSAQAIVKGINTTLLRNQDATIGYLMREVRIDIMEPDAKERATQKLLETLQPYEERVTHAEVFNDMLRTEAQKQGIPYFDINDATKLDGDVRPEFLPLNDLDNHLTESAAIGKIHQDALADAILQL